MAEFPGTIEELDEHISTLRENLRELIEQAAAHSGAADDELTSQRIEEQEALLETLTKSARNSLLLLWARTTRTAGILFPLVQASPRAAS